MSIERFGSQIFPFLNGIHCLQKSAAASRVHHQIDRKDPMNLLDALTVAAKRQIGRKSDFRIRIRRCKNLPSGFDQ